MLAHNNAKLGLQDNLLKFILKNATVKIQPT